MARSLRIEYAGAIYHVMARGNQGQKIYADDGDRKLWLSTLGQAWRRTGWRIHAFVLLGNHYHLLLETPEANLEAYLETRVLELGLKAGRKELEAAWEGLRRGWYVGGEGFGKGLLARAKEVLSGKRPESHAGGARRAHDLAQARRMVQVGMGRLGLEEVDLAQTPKGQIEKQVLAWWLYGRTTAARRGIAENLKMGYESRVSQAVRAMESSQAPDVIKMKKKLVTRGI